MTEELFAPVIAYSDDIDWADTLQLADESVCRLTGAVFATDEDARRGQ
jgi:acyl-CoA reductase-like NAD-dependent aldehyde dehydrogenase